MGKTYRKNSDDGWDRRKKNPSPKNRKKGKGYNTYNYGDADEAESVWDDYSQDRESSFEKFSKKKKKK